MTHERTVQAAPSSFFVLVSLALQRFPFLPNLISTPLPSTRHFPSPSIPFYYTFTRLGLPALRGKRLHRDGLSLAPSFFTVTSFSRFEQFADFISNNPKKQRKQLERNNLHPSPLDHPQQRRVLLSLLRRDSYNFPPTLKVLLLPSQHR